MILGFIRLEVSVPYTYLHCKRVSNHFCSVGGGGGEKKLLVEVTE
jgi:hypothetical protein